MSQHNQPAAAHESIPVFYREVLPCVEVNSLTGLLANYYGVEIFDPLRLDLLTPKEILSLPPGTIDTSFIEDIEDESALTRAKTLSVHCTSSQIVYVHNVRHFTLLFNPRFENREERSLVLDLLLKKIDSDELPTVFQNFRWQVLFGNIPSDAPRGYTERTEVRVNDKDI
jgi:hypothetical protein